MTFPMLIGQSVLYIEVCQLLSIGRGLDVYLVLRYDPFDAEKDAMVFWQHP